MKILPRTALQDEIIASLKQYPITLLLSPRQCGKTTIARKISSHLKANYFDFENPEEFIHENQIITRLRDLKGLVIIDECQKQPALFSVLRVLADRRPLPARFLLLGRSSPDLVKGTSETLAGRISYLYMEGFSIEECPTNKIDQLWIRGGFPDSFLASTEEKSFSWRLNFMQ